MWPDTVLAISSSDPSNRVPVEVPATHQASRTQLSTTQGNLGQKLPLALNKPRKGLPSKNDTVT